MKYTFNLSLALILLVGCSPSSNDPIPRSSLKAGSEREIAYTDKGDAFWVTRTGGYHSSPWHGLSASKRQYFEDLFISVDGKLLDRESAEITVDPVALTRTYQDLGINETWSMVDKGRGLLVVLEGSQAHSWQVQPAIMGGGKDEDFEFSPVGPDLNVDYRGLKELKSAYKYLNIHFSQEMVWSEPVDPEKMLYNSFLTPSAHYAKSHKLAILIRVGDEPFHSPEPGWVERIASQRQDRISRLLERSVIQSSSQPLPETMAWAHASLDALIMEQMGEGIYAGLPWFDDYWGRDVFISFTGATLVSGKFETARNILRSFARLQNKDQTSQDYGRVPNRAQPEDIIFNTTDGTPWFVRSVWEYVRYSGDMDFLEEMWPAIRMATEGSLKNWVDEAGFLRHAQADTWMDAKGPDGPWSPRGDRAIDIQFLWQDQLEVTLRLAQDHGEQELARKCDLVLQQLWESLDTFRHPEQGHLVDHLNDDGSQDSQLRPNALLVPPMFHSHYDWPTFKVLAPQLMTQNGILSLAQEDENFHPYHQMAGLYVKDAAYHNGIIWTWNSAAALTPAIHFGQMHYPEAIFKDLSRLVLDRGAVGTMAELTDAWPRNGELQLSGTFSQAWSLAEYLRVFYQDLMGIKPDLTANQVHLRPRLLEDWQDLAFTHPIGNDTWTVNYSEDRESFEIDISREGTEALDLTIDLLVEGVIPEIRFAWTQTDLHLRYEKRMGQWTVPGTIIDYTQTSSSPAWLEDQLSFASVDTSILIPVLMGPEHRLLKEHEVAGKPHDLEVLLHLEDVPGDDEGDTGSLVYPGNPQFEPGIADIHSFTLEAGEHSYAFEIQFSNLVDPGWHPEYGYQLTYIALGINDSPNPGTSEIGMNSQGQFLDGFRADKLIYISGGVLMVSSDGTALAEYMPVTSAGAIGNAETETVKFRLPKDLFDKDLAQATFQIAVGLQDDHGGAGLGDFRAVDVVGSEWSGGGLPVEGGSYIYDRLIQPK